MNTQISKGILEGCIIQLVGNDETYGYKVVEQLNAIGMDVNEATVYPILKRLEKRGLLVVTKKPSALGPMRKYFRLSALGEEELLDFIKVWEETKLKVDLIIRGHSND